MVIIPGRVAASFAAAQTSNLPDTQNRVADNARATGQRITARGADVRMPSMLGSGGYTNSVSSRRAINDRRAATRQFWRFDEGVSAERVLLDVYEIAAPATSRTRQDQAAFMGVARATNKSDLPSRPVTTVIDLSGGPGGCTEVNENSRRLGASGTFSLLNAFLMFSDVFVPPHSTDLDIFSNLVVATGAKPLPLLPSASTFLVFAFQEAAAWG